MIGGAQNVDRFFNLAFDPDIGDTTLNTSTTIPHATIIGTGDRLSFDYYSFTVDSAGTKVVLDINGALLAGVQQDTMIFVYNAAGALIFANDDAANVAFGAGGSTSALK